MTSKAMELAQLGDAVTVDGSKVGINTSSPDLTLDVSHGTTAEYVSTFQNTADNLELKIGTTTGGVLNIQGANASNNNAYDFSLNADGGSVRVAKTSAALAVVGHELSHEGYAYHTRDGGTAMYINRKSSDGNLADFYRDSYVGAIGAVSGDIFIAGPDSNHAALRLAANSRAVLPVTSGGSLSDNNTDIGTSSARFDDIHASNGTIQTSDRNEKQQIATLTSAEITAAKAISQLFKTYKWNDSVAEKGDAARTHTGVIAQEVEQAMTDAGLDAGNYAFFISTTWWETSTEVAAVEADEENSIKAQEAYTRIDTYNTSEEAPEGATERNRKGIRYPELLSFVGAATEQRLTSIEARLDALEAE